MSCSTTLSLDERGAALGLLYCGGGQQSSLREPPQEERPVAPVAASTKVANNNDKPKNLKQQKTTNSVTIPEEDPVLNISELLGSKDLKHKTQKKKRPYYLTTAINYANGSPHMGHAYEALLTDVLARYRRLAGHDTFFLTGADEHGQKIANTAARLNVTPQTLIDDCVARFKALDEKLDVSYDFYIRTTMDHHKRGCQELWRRCAGDITLERYEGWYDERAEMFVKNSDAEAQGFKDADGIPLKRTTEECYFFALGKYANVIKKHITDTHPDFILPASRRAEVLKMLEDEEALEKLSVSRTTFDWGVKLPDGFDSNHVMYVWIDALTNYLTGIGWPSDAENVKKWWPCNVHVIGKDIARFHAIYWPAILKSAQIEWPRQIFCHGFVLDASGAKMSKTLGNVLDAETLIDKYGSDAFRYFSVKEASPGADVKFSETALILSRNTELADGFGNLVHRATALATSKANGKVPCVGSSVETLPFDLLTVLKSCEKAMEEFDVATYAKTAMAAARDANKWLQDMAPWTMKGETNLKRDAILRILLESCYALSLILAPVIPRAATLAARRVGGDLTNPPSLDALDPTFQKNLREGATVFMGSPLFAQIDIATDDVAAALKAEKQKNSNPKGNNGQKKQAAKKGPKGGNNKATTETTVVDYGDEDDTAASRLALVVGRIVECWPHPDSDKLFCEKIDCGEAFGGVRQIGSGLRKHYQAADLENRLVLVAANLKSKKLAGFPSQGMVLCASDPASGRTVCVDPPRDARPGDRVLFPGLDGNSAASDSQCDKKKLFVKAQPHFKVTENGVCCYKDKPFAVPGRDGPCTAPAAIGVPIC